MSDNKMNYYRPLGRSPIIKVVGIGGGGTFAVNLMFEKGIKNVSFVVCDSNNMDLANSSVPIKVPIGKSLTEGRGAGRNPEVGRQAAIENISDIMDVLLGNTKMVFLVTCMGGGTGTGAISIIAKACKEAGLLTIAVVTIPFKSEGKVVLRQAINGVTELKDKVDSLLVINNEKLKEIYRYESIYNVFDNIDNIILTAVKAIAEIITVSSYINVDFEDVETVMKNSGISIMGYGKASGKNRAIKAIKEALTSPLLNSNEITGANSILINISSGIGEYEISMDELGEITDYIYDAVSDYALIIRGLSSDEILNEEIHVTVIATGFESNSIFQSYISEETSKVELILNRNEIPPRIIRETGDALFSMYAKPRKSIAISIEEESGDVNLDIERGEDLNEIRRKRSAENPENNVVSVTTLRKVKRMRTILKREGLSFKPIREITANLGDENTYVRRKAVESQNEDDVFLGTASPNTVFCGEEFVVRFNAYTSRYRYHVIKILNQEAPSIKPSLDLETCKWKRGVKVSVYFHSSDLDIQNPIQNFKWNGKYHVLRFDAKVKSNIVTNLLILKFDVSVERLPILYIRPEINLALSKSAIRTDTTVKLIERPSPKSAFASYAKNDRLTVLGRVRSVQISTGIDVYLDCLSLIPGEKWKSKLEYEIIQRDIFWLFWSREAKKSKWVEWEWRTALKYKAIAGIQPHPLEPVDIAPPPKELSELQFGSLYEWYMTHLKDIL